MPYQLLIDLAALELLTRQPPWQRRRFLDHFHRLRSYPAACSDYRDSDACNRQVHVSVFEGFAIYYWIDEADQHVKILEIVVADRNRPPSP